MPLIAMVEGATRNLGAPADWKPEHGHCGGLPVADVMTEQGPFMVSAWELTPDEILAIMGGATLKLWVRGNVHPVVALSVGPLTMKEGG